jgi:hypothetical protein
MKSYQITVFQYIKMTNDNERQRFALLATLKNGDHFSYQQRPYSALGYQMPVTAR